MTDLTSPPLDYTKLREIAEKATPGPWDRMKGRELVRAIRDDLAIPLFQAQEPYGDPLLATPTCRVGNEVVFRANSQGARESAALKQASANAEYQATFDPPTVLALLADNARMVKALEEIRDMQVRFQTDSFCSARDRCAAIAVKALSGASDHAD